MKEIQEKEKAFYQEATRRNDHMVDAGISPVLGKDYDRTLSSPKYNMPKGGEKGWQANGKSWRNSAKMN